MDRTTNFKPKIGLNDDPLFFLMEMTYIRQLKASRPLQILLLIPNTWYFCISILAFYRMVFNFKENQAFVVNFLFLVQGVSSTLTIWVLRNLVLNYRTVIKMNFWSLHSAGDELFGQIANECRSVIKKTAYAVLCITMMSALTQMYYNGDEVNWQFSLNLLSKWPKCIGIPMIIMSETVCVIWGQILSIPATVLLYVINHIKFQYTVLNKHFEAISEKIGDVTNKNYQEWVNTSLRQCVLIHTNILRSTKIAMKWFPLFTIGLIAMALTAFVAPAYFIYAQISPKDNIRMYVILVTCMIQECICCDHCQHMEDESLKMFSNAYNCPWNDWDSRNRQFLVMIMVNSMKPIQTSKYGLPSGNYEMILRLWRAGYAILTLFSHTNMKLI